MLKSSQVFRSNTQLAGNLGTRGRGKILREKLRQKHEMGSAIRQTGLLPAKSQFDGKKGHGEPLQMETWQTEQQPNTMRYLCLSWL